MNESTLETLSLQQQEGYRCVVNFGGDVPPLISDEPRPLGTALGPSPVQLLLAAVANCLTDSLLFALRKFKQQAEPLHCEASAEVGRNAEKRLRVLAIDVKLRLGADAGSIQYLERILDQFEGFCTVTQSVALGIPVRLTVLDAHDRVVKASIDMENSRELLSPA